MLVLLFYWPRHLARLPINIFIFYPKLSTPPSTVCASLYLLLFSSWLFLFVLTNLILLLRVNAMGASHHGTSLSVPYRRRIARGSGSLKRGYRGTR